MICMRNFTVCSSVFYTWLARDLHAQCRQSLLLVLAVKANKTNLMVRNAAAKRAHSVAKPNQWQMT